MSIAAEALGERAVADQPRTGGGGRVPAARQVIAKRDVILIPEAR